MPRSIVDEPFVPKTEFEAFHFNKGEAEGKAKGKGEAKADAVLRILQRRFGYANESLNQRLHAETRIDLLDTWFDDALMLADEPALHRLVEQILFRTTSAAWMDLRAWSAPACMT
jgi:hypothetical protein